MSYIKFLIYKAFPDEVKELLRAFPHDAESIKITAPIYKDNKDLIDKLEKTILSRESFESNFLKAFKTLLPSYLERPELIESVYSKHRYDLVNGLADAYEISPKYTKMAFEILRDAHDEKDFMFRGQTAFVNNFVSKAHRIDDEINMIENTILEKDKKLNAVEIEKIIKISENDIPTFKRVVKDGKYKSFDELSKLQDLYRKYPNIKITDKMIEAYLAPYGDVFV